MKLFIQEAAEQDILNQIAWYAEQGVPDIAVRFSAAAAASLETLMAMPEGGAPKATPNLPLTGLRTWPVKGFDNFRIYYLVQSDLLIVEFASCTTSAILPRCWKGRGWRNPAETDNAAARVPVLCCSVASP